MPLLILIAASALSAVIILYALWSWAGENSGRKAFVMLLAGAALILPGSFKYFYGPHDEGALPDNLIQPGELPDVKKSIWSGGTSQMPVQGSSSGAKDMSMSSVTARLEAKLKDNPDDLDGWILLGRSYAALGDPEKAVSLFNKKIAENPENVNLIVSYGETLTKLNSGIITDEARGLFQKALTLEPNQPRAEYNLALYDMQHDQNQKAYDRLKKLLDSAPANAPLAAQIRERMTLAGAKLGLVTQAPNPTAEQVAAAKSMSPDDQNAFIRTMVGNLAAKLKENPNDLQGWLRLGKSYEVLQDWSKATFAYDQALKLSPNDASIKQRRDATATKAGQ